MEPLLKVRNLDIRFPQSGVHAVKGIDFEVGQGEILVMAGESGSGKTVSLKSILGLRPSKSKEVKGQIYYGGEDLLKLSEKELRIYRGREITMIFQNPYVALDPTMRCGKQIAEALLTEMSRQEKERKVKELLHSVELTEVVMKRYPHELSGGMCQRVMIAIALASNPKLLLADEPTAALDVVIQKQFLRLLETLNKKMGLSILLVTHDMNVARQIAHRVAVMHQGEIEFEGKNIFHMSKPELAQYHKDVQMIFQDPYTAIDPVWPIYKALEEAMTIQKLYEKAERKDRAVEMLKKVGVDRWNAYPRELSGGQIQRACIARAIVLKPKMLVCDEATSALDASVKAQIVNLLLELQEEYGLSYLFITHDLAMLKHLADEVAVMQKGHIVEYAGSEQIYEAPDHFYTRELLAAAANRPY